MKLGGIPTDHEQKSGPEKDKLGKAVILVDTKDSTPLLVYYTKCESEDVQILMLVDKYLQSSRYQKIPEHLKVQRIVNHLKEKGYKSVDFEMKEV